MSVVLAADAYAISGSEKHPDSAGTAQKGRIIQLFTNPAPPQPTCESRNSDRQPAATVGQLLETAKRLEDGNWSLLSAALRYFAPEINSLQRPGRFHIKTLDEVVGVQARDFGGGPVVEIGASRSRPSAALASAAASAFAHTAQTGQSVVMRIRTDGVVRQGLVPVRLTQTLIVAPKGWLPHASVRVPKEARVLYGGYLAQAWMGGRVPDQVDQAPMTVTVTHKRQPLEESLVAPLLGRRLAPKVRQLRVLPVSHVTAWQRRLRLVQRNK